jgi:hypothetical protein
MLSLNISENLQKELEELASEQGIELEQLVERALLIFIKTEKAESKPAIVTLDEVIASAQKLGLPPKPPLKLNVHEWPNFPPDATFRREEIYDDGR